MKLNKVIQELKAFFSLSEESQLEQRQTLKEILKKLRVKEKKLQDKLEQEKSAEKKKEIKNELNIIHLQRKKGVSILKDEDIE